MKNRRENRNSNELQDMHQQGLEHARSRSKRISIKINSETHAPGFEPTPQGSTALNWNFKTKCTSGESNPCALGQEALVKRCVSLKLRGTIHKPGQCTRVPVKRSWPMVPTHRHTRGARWT